MNKGAIIVQSEFGKPITVILITILNVRVRDVEIVSFGILRLYTYLANSGIRGRDRIIDLFFYVFTNLAPNLDIFCESIYFYSSGLFLSLSISLKPRARSAQTKR